VCYVAAAMSYGTKEFKYSEQTSEFATANIHVEHSEINVQPETIIIRV
jgi:hypothetical protein